MAASERTIVFTNGQAQNISLPIGKYTYVSSTIPGYTDATVEGFEIRENTKRVELSITANGRLKVHVIDDLDEEIVSGSLQFSDSTGKTTYGAPAVINKGYATFKNVPYDESEGINVWISQPASDDTHDPIKTPQAEVLTEAESTAVIINKRETSTVDIALEDHNYPGIAGLTGSITFMG